MQHSTFARSRLNNAYTQDLSDKYDYPSIAILDHGYFCYSNGFYTTLLDMQNLINQLLDDPIFAMMTDIKHARAASRKIMNGLTVELRIVGDDIIYGYEGLSFSGCNLWAYSTKQKKGYVTFHNSEEEIYTIIYEKCLSYKDFDLAPDLRKLTIKNFYLSTNHLLLLQIFLKNIKDTTTGLKSMKKN